MKHGDRGINSDHDRGRNNYFAPDTENIRYATVHSVIVFFKKINTLSSISYLFAKFISKGGIAFRGMTEQISQGARKTDSVNRCFFLLHGEIGLNKQLFSTGPPNEYYEENLC